MISAALVGGHLEWANSCSVCEANLTRPHQWHLERYDVPLSAFPICRRCHRAIHLRFYEPKRWHQFIIDVACAGWVYDLNTDVASLERPYAETYPDLDLVFMPYQSLDEAKPAATIGAVR